MLKIENLKFKILILVLFLNLITIFYLLGKSQKYFQTSFMLIPSPDLLKNPQTINISTSFTDTDNKLNHPYYNFTGPKDELTIEDNPRYVLYECVKPLCGGWGDRLKGILSSYAWSILTDRQFRIKMTYPCEFSTLLLPNDINWNSPILTDLSSRHYEYSLDDFKFAKRLTDLDISTFHADKNLLIFLTNRDWFESFAINPHLTKKLSSLGYTNQSQFRLFYLFRNLYNRMFQVGPDLQSDYDNLLKIRQNTDNLFCAQIRIGGAREHVSHDYQFNQRNVTKLFWKFIREKFINNTDGKDFKLFLTSDLGDVLKEAKSEFGDDRVFYTEGPNTHLDREKQSQNCSRVKNTFLDVHFLQHCDRIVISNSNYGKFGVMLRSEPSKHAFIFSDGNFKPIDESLKF